MRILSAVAVIWPAAAFALDTGITKLSDGNRAALWLTFDAYCADDNTNTRLCARHVNDDGTAFGELDTTSYYGTVSGSGVSISPGKLGNALKFSGASDTFAVAPAQLPQGLNPLPATHTGTVLSFSFWLRVFAHPQTTSQEPEHSSVFSISLPSLLPTHIKLLEFTVRGGPNKNAVQLTEWVTSSNGGATGHVYTASTALNQLILTDADDWTHVTIVYTSPSVHLFPYGRRPLSHTDPLRQRHRRQRQHPIGRYRHTDSCGAGRYCGCNAGRQEKVMNEVPTIGATGLNVPVDAYPSLLQSASFSYGGVTTPTCPATPTYGGGGAAVPTWFDTKLYYYTMHLITPFANLVDCGFVRTVDTTNKVVVYLGTTCATVQHSRNDEYSVALAPEPVLTTFTFCQKLQVTYPSEITAPIPPATAPVNIIDYRFVDFSYSSFTQGSPYTDPATTQTYWPTNLTVAVTVQWPYQVSAATLFTVTTTVPTLTNLAYDTTTTDCGAAGTELPCAQTFTFVRRTGVDTLQGPVVASETPTAANPKCGGQVEWTVALTWTCRDSKVCQGDSTKACGTVIVAPNVCVTVQTISSTDVTSSLAFYDSNTFVAASDTFVRGAPVCGVMTLQTTNTDFYFEAYQVSKLKVTWGGTTITKNTDLTLSGNPGNGFSRQFTRFSRQFTRQSNTTACAYFCVDVNVGFPSVASIRGAQRTYLLEVSAELSQRRRRVRGLRDLQEENNVDEANIFKASRSLNIMPEGTSSAKPWPQLPTVRISEGKASAYVAVAAMLGAVLGFAFGVALFAMITHRRASHYSWVPVPQRPQA